MPPRNKTMSLDVASQGYCRSCQKVMTLNKFYIATNPAIDVNGYMSICKECCNKRYSDYFIIHNNLEKALNLTCQELDVCFNYEALIQTKTHVEKLLERGKPANAVFGYYKSKLSSTGKINANIDSFRYKDSDVYQETNQKENNNIDSLKKEDNSNEDIDITNDMISYWGKIKEKWEYMYLDNEMFRLQTDFECPDYGMEIIMKDICFINLDIEKIRRGIEKGDVTKLMKTRSDLMNDANLKPIQSTGADKNERISFGVLLKKFENEKPIRKELDDEMKRYIDIYMIGHLACMEGLDNELTREYKKAINDFSINLEDINKEEDDE